MTLRGQQRRVGQKLAYARWHLQWSEQMAQNAQQRAGLLESAVWHGAGAYRAFLAEIAADVHMVADPQRLDTTSALGLSQAYKDYLPAALAECANLERRQGWLQDLLQWSDYVARSNEEPVASTAGVISSSVSPAANSPDYARLEQCLQHLEQLIDRLRGDMLEY